MRVWGSALTVCALSTTILQAQTPVPDLQAAFDGLETSWAANDTTTFVRFVAQDGLLVHPDGTCHTRQEEVGEISEGASQMSPRAADSRDVVRASGSTAVRRYSAESGLVTQVWRRQPDGGWRLQFSNEGFGVRMRCGDRIPIIYVQ
jgi:ketosteroid isomerase-like protein